MSFYNIFEVLMAIQGDLDIKNENLDCVLYEFSHLVTFKWPKITKTANQILIFIYIFKATNSNYKKMQRNTPPDIFKKKL